MRKAWLQAWRDRCWRRALSIGLLVVLPLIYFLPAFFALIEERPGVFLHDPVLDAIGPVAVSGWTFGVLYSLVVISILWLTGVPFRFVRMIHAYAFLLLMRMVTMYTITLEAPVTIIPLIDPITQVFYPTDQPFLKDLFFSGHTATAVLFALAVGPGKLRVLFGVGAFVIGFLVILQHVHYTMDVLAAPFFATLAWYLSGKTMDLCGVRGVHRSGTQIP